MKAIFPGSTLALALLTTGLSTGVPTPVLAQATTVATPQERAAFQARADAQRKLAGALSRIAADGSNGFALLDAGEAALALKDPQAALGFLARAEHSLPREARVKSALGAGMIAVGRPADALRYFGQAQVLGATETTYLAERALAYDLNGDNQAALRDYRAALARQPGDPETVRRYAISLGVAGDIDGAMKVLSPLLVSQDRAAWRAQAFVLAMNGREKEAAKTVDSVMPANLAQAIKPYLAQMDRLTAAQKSAAANLGKFPSGTLGAAPVRVASADTAAPPKKLSRSEQRRAEREAAKAARAQPTRSASAGTSPLPVGRRVAAVAVPIATPPPPKAPPASKPVPAPTPTPTPAATQPVRLASVQPSRVALPPSSVPSSPPSAVERGAVVPVSSGTMPNRTMPSGLSRPPIAAATTVPTRAAETAAIGPTLPPGESARPGFSIVDAGKPAAATLTIAAPATTGTAYGPPVLQPQKSLFDIVAAIDVADVASAAPAISLNAADLEKIKQERLAAQEAAELRDAKEKERAKADVAAKSELAVKAKADAAAKAEKAANPARAWVQVATGSDARALAFDYRKLAKKYPALFKSQSGWTSEWGRTRRLVVGPFDNAKAAKAWDADYRKAGGDSFVWTSSDGLEVEKLAGK